MVSRPYYLLFEAFETLGRHLYGGEWTNNEITAARNKSPDEVEREIRQFLATVSDIDKRLEQLTAESKKLLTRERTAEIEAEKNELGVKRLKAVSKHPDFWAPDWAERLVGSARTYQRKVLTETALIEAIKAGKFRVESLRQMLDPWVWKDRVVYHNLELSLVLGPRSWGDKANRFQLVRIPQKEFDEWLKSVRPINPDALRAMQSPEDLCKEFLAGEVAKYGSNKPMKRDAFFERAASTISGLKKQTFLRAWHAVVPESWRDAGTLRKTNRRP